MECVIVKIHRNIRWMQQRPSPKSTVKYSRISLISIRRVRIIKDSTASLRVVSSIASSSKKKEIKDNVARYLPEITVVLSRVPREMLLVFKTNDLLRGIEASLGVKGAAGSFIAMSKCCIKALYEEKLKSCQSFFDTIRVSVSRTLAYTRIFMYQYYLWFRTFNLSRLNFLL